MIFMAIGPDLIGNSEFTSISYKYVFNLENLTSNKFSMILMLYGSDEIILTPKLSCRPLVSKERSKTNENALLSVYFCFFAPFHLKTGDLEISGRYFGFLRISEIRIDCA